MYHHFPLIIVLNQKRQVLFCFYQGEFSFQVGIKGKTGVLDKWYEIVPINRAQLGKGESGHQNFLTKGLVDKL